MRAGQPALGGRNSSVLILEAGGSDRTPIVRIPAGEIFAIASPRYNWNYDAEPDPSLNDRVTKWPGGRVLGGSSSINGMIYLRGQREDYDDWAACSAAAALELRRRPALLQAHGVQRVRRE